MESLPFASKPVQNSVWGCGDFSNGNKVQNIQHIPKKSEEIKITKRQECTSPIEISSPGTNYEYMPAVLLNSLKRDKKPFTYTPGRLDLSEVLNDKLEKRMRRRKKRDDERVVQRCSPVQELPTFESPKQVLVMPTYNSPLNMYSMENALEALEAQAEVVVSDKSLSPPPLPAYTHSMTLPRNYKYEPMDFEPKNVIQSKAFRVLQIITDTDEELGQDGPEHNPDNFADEMQFKSIRPSETIPSKYFQNLQKLTGTDGTNQTNTIGNTEYKGNQERFRDEMRFSGTRPSKEIPSFYSPTINVN